MMTPTHMQIGFIGAGGIALSRHLPNLAAIAGVQLIAVANQRIENAKQVAETFGFRKVYSDWKEVVDDPDVNIVFICTPPSLHNEMTCYALAKGKHVFCQARMGMDLEDAKEMLAADKLSSQTTMLCPPPHYLNAAPFIQQLLAKETLGEIRHVLLTHPTAAWLDPQQPLHWRQKKDKQGINVLDVGIMGEVLQKWFGPVKSVCAISKTWVTERPADHTGQSTVELPDSVTVSGQFTSEATLTALFSGSVSGGRSQMIIYGSRATLTCYQGEPFIEIQDASGTEKIEIPADSVGHWTVEQGFLDAIREGRKGSPSFIEGIRYMAFTQAVIDSISTGQRIDLEQLS